jgi:hypothetical protein
VGYKLKRKEVGKLEGNEEKDLCLILEKEDRAAIHGVVKFCHGGPVHGAIVKLFRKEDSKRGDKCSDPCELIPVTFAFTDECGQFLFGVDSCVDYVIKVFFYIPETIGPSCKKSECMD